MSKKRISDSKRAKEKDRNQRLLSHSVLTQLDNAIYAFMYAVESEELEVDKAAEDHMIELLFDQSTIKKCVETIAAKERSSKELIEFAEKVAGSAVGLAKENKEEKVSVDNVKQAIESMSEGDRWFLDTEAERKTK